ncbi:PAS domain S-box protein [Leptolyngbya sp. FACHB-261]|uniref:PAS domain S-box protein n=1 Tax=Leptolyngbya sp. FACHB-261 TaxID=2692806 RepID=UPI001685D20E|nr:PAS domain S-box protein [Leptolyngbya sp. FACHB-261]MBD2102701.1 PAS domain S-box protein [Leptolyngbya sp. FACHB-261]
MSLKTCLGRLSTALNRTKQPATLFQVVVEELRQVLQVDRCLLWTLQAEGLVLHWEARSAEGLESWLGQTIARGDWPDAWQRLQQNQVLNGRNGRSAQSRAWVLPDVLAGQNFFGLPVFAQGELVGLLGFCHSEPLQYAPSQLTLLQQLAELTGVVFTQVRLSRQATEVTLKLQEDQYRLLFENNPCPTWVYDTETLAFLAINTAAVRHYGYSEAEFLSMTVLDIRPPEEVPALLSLLKDGRDGDRSTCDFRHRKKDGTLINVEVSSHAIVFADRPARVTSVKDVTKRKQAEKALQASEARQWALLNAIPDLMIRMTRDGTYLDFIPAKDFKTIMPSGGLIGKNIWEIMPPLIAQQRMQYVEQALATGSNQVYEYELDIDGCITCEEARIVVSGEDEVLVIVRDITERKQTEAALLRARGAEAANRELEQEIAERSRIEQALRESEAHYRAIVEDQTELICRSLQDGTLTFVNNAFCRYFNKQPQELIGQSFFSLIAEEDQKTPKRHLTAFSPTNPTAIYEHCVVLGDGSRRWQQWTERAIFDHQDQVVEIQSVGRDITEYKQAEEERRRSEERFRISVESLLDCFGIYSAIRDETGRIVDFCVEYVNAAACENNQMAKEQQLGKGLLELFPIHQEIGLFDAYCQVVDTGQPLVKDVLIYRDSSGSRRLAKAFDTNATKLGDGLALAWRDTTERRQIEERMRLLQSAVEQSCDAVLIIEAEPMQEPGPRILFANPAFTTMTGYTLEETLGRSPRFLQGPNTDPQEVARIRKALRTWQPITSELINYRKDGSEFWVELNIVPMADERGWYTHWLATQRDITERKRSEALARANRSLQQANANLKRLEKLKSEMVAAVSHEIRMPIATVCTAVAALAALAPELPPNARDMLDLSNSESRRLVRLVNDLLDFSKLDSGTYRWREEPVRLSAVLAQAMQSTCALYESRELQLFSSIPELDLEVWGDADRLVQVVINLLDNAAKFSAAHSSVCLELRQEGKQALISVRDQGPGIASEHREAIFELFSQVRQPNSERPQGIGLGLYLCRQIVHHHGGRIIVETQMGQGSTFHIQLPLLKATSLRRTGKLRAEALDVAL